MKRHTMLQKISFLLVLGSVFATAIFVSPLSFAESAKDKKPADPLSGGDFSKSPTYIKSKTLEIRNTERVFTYKDRVEVTQNDLRMTSQKLVGTYDENHKIQEMVATGDVVVTKGEGVRATGGRAVYTAGVDKVTLTESPELMQNGSILVADKVIVMLNENRALADGDVKVKVLQSAAGKSTDPKELIK